MKSLLKKAAFLLIITVIGLATVNTFSEGVWRLDKDPKLTKPVNFRMTSDDWRVAPGDKPPSREGLADLRASGSAQASAKGYVALYAMLSAAAPGAPIYVADLRQESHGFADGIPVSWYKTKNQANAKKTADEVIADETKRLSSLVGKTVTFVPEGADTNQFKAVTITPKVAKTEQETVEAIGYRYARFFATDKSWPNTEAVEAFVDFAEALPNNAWVHFHCLAGQGRTTSFMAIYDMIRNPDVPVDDIIKRQYLIGGIDLTAINKDERDASIRRLKLLQLFSRYYREKCAGKTGLRWGAWLKKYQDGN